jgi:hypothetical protein
VYDPPLTKLYVGTAGDLKVDTYDGSTVTLTGVPAGTFLDDVAVKKVYDTGSSAGAIIGFKPLPVRYALTHAINVGSGSDATEYDSPITLLYVGGDDGAGHSDIKITTWDGNTVTLADVPVGSFITDVAIKKVFDTDTEATLLIGFRAQ